MVTDMISLQDISIKLKLRAVIFIISLILLGVATTGWIGIRHLNEQTVLLGESYMPALDLLVQADRDLYQAVTAEWEALAIEPGTERYGQMIKDREENISQARTRVGKFSQAIPLTEEMKDNVAQFERLIAVWDKSSRAVLDERVANSGEAARIRSVQQYAGLDGEFQQARDRIDQLTKLAEEAAEAAVTSAESMGAGANITMLVSSGVGLAFCLVFAIWFPLLITRPLKSVMESLSEFAHGEGDLTRRLEVRGKDEFGQLSELFNRFIDKLQDIIKQVSDVTIRLAAAAEELSVITTQTSQSVLAQRSETDQVATALSEMSATAIEVARNATHTANSARQSDEQVSKGRSQVLATTGHINKLAKEVEQAAETIHRLEQDSQEIGQIVDVIQSIAEQTNLLALNAAIEAARAGEQGRGFAVVADEVRTLASRTQQSTKQIREMIERLQQGAALAGRAVESGQTEAQSTVKEAEATSQILDAIVQEVSSITDITAQIASAAEEQRAVTEEVSRSVVNISEVATQTADGAQQTATASKELSELAALQQSLVGRFRV